MRTRFPRTGNFADVGVAAEVQALEFSPVLDVIGQSIQLGVPEVDVLREAMEMRDARHAIGSVSYFY